jgi:hypothetical protein
MVMSDKHCCGSGVTSRTLFRLVLLAVPVVALAVLAPSALALFRGETAAPAAQFRTLDVAAFAAIERAHAPTAVSSTEDAPEVEIANWEHTDGGSGKKF